MNDTTQKMRKKQLEIMLNMTKKQRFEQGMQMIDFVKKTVENSIKKQKPNLNETELKIEVFKRYYGKEFTEVEKVRIINYFTVNQ